MAFSSEEKEENRRYMSNAEKRILRGIRSAGDKVKREIALQDTLKRVVGTPIVVKDEDGNDNELTIMEELVVKKIAYDISNPKNIDLTAYRKALGEDKISVNATSYIYKNTNEAQEINKSTIISTSEVYEACVALKDAIDNGYEIEVDFFSNICIPEFQESPYHKFNKITCNFVFYGADEISESIKSNDASKLVINLEKDYGTCLYGIKISSTRDFDVYSTSISGKLLAKLYKDFKSRLLEGNVRSYLKRNQKVNSGIAKTIETTPSEFVAYNNGLSTVASIDGSKIKQT